MSLHRIVIRCLKHNILPEYEEFYFNTNKEFIEIIKKLNNLKIIERNIKINKKLLKKDEDYYKLYRALYNIEDTEKLDISKKEIHLIFKKDNYYA